MIARARRGAAVVWDWLRDPPHMRPLYTWAYFLSTMIGLVTFMSPPRTIEGVAGATLAAVWAVCFIVGGVIGLGTIWVGWWWLERIGLAIIGIGGVGMYGVVVLYLQLTESGSRLTQLGVILLAGVAVLARFFSIWPYSFQPRPERFDTQRG